MILTVSFCDVDYSVRRISTRDPIRFPCWVNSAKAVYKDFLPVNRYDYIITTKMRKVQVLIDCTKIANIEVRKFG